MTVQIKYNDLTKASHQCGLSAATNITKEIYDTVCRLFDEKWDGTPIRLLGVSTKVAIADNGRQMDLFDDTDYEKLEKLAPEDRNRIYEVIDTLVKQSKQILP